MTKLKLFLAGSFVAKIGIVAALYITVFKTNSVAGFLMLAAHALYEVSEVVISKEYHRLQAEAESNFAEQLNKKLGGGSC